MDKHPEQREGEVFLTNANEEDFKNLHLKTKRRGNIPYDIYGRIVKHYKEHDFRPVFIQISEKIEREKEGK